MGYSTRNEDQLHNHKLKVYTHPSPKAFHLLTLKSSTVVDWEVATRKEGTCALRTRGLF